ncbi:uncharacterized protein LOC141691219 [Apium graveolens]|uniref:uncharacterized protein LOC141691219 n=1 Tax=Apium graveolens TaxID=4045 RepID=UPI003D7A248F
MAMEMEKTRQELAELKGLLSKANISSPLFRIKQAGPRKCELAVGTIENKVAFGLLFDDDDMNKSIHGLPMQPGCARVSVDGQIEGQTKIPVPVVGEIEIVEQAVGSYVSWPRDLIIFPDAPATAKSKRKGKDPLTDLHKVQSLFENMEINKNVPQRFRLLYKHVTETPFKSRAMRRYLYCMVCENENLEQFAFCYPGVSFTLNNNFEDNLLPLDIGCDLGGRGFHTQSSASFNYLSRVGKSNIKGCPKQPGGTECGYVVMWYMKEIAMDNEMTFVKKWSTNNRKVTVAKAELDEFWNGKMAVDMFLDDSCLGFGHLIETGDS